MKMRLHKRFNLSAILLTIIPYINALPHDPIAPSSITTPDAALSSGAEALRKAYLKYGVTLPNALVARSGDAVAAITGNVTATPTQYDTTYLSPVLIGSPAASASTYSMWLNTGGAEVSVYAPKLGKQGSTITTTVTIGGVAVKNSAVVLNSDASGSSNVVGMSCRGSGNGGQTWYTNAVAQGLPAVFAANLKHQAPGTYTLGYVDSSMYSGNITYVQADGSQGFWGFSGNGYAIGTGTFTSLTINAIIDTGTTLLLLPSSVVSAYYKQVQGAVYDNSQGGYTFPCTAKLPNLILGTGGYRATVPGAYINYAPVDTNGKTCFGGVQEDQGIGFSVFGLVFIKSQFVVFKGTSSSSLSLGFAKKV